MATENYQNYSNEINMVENTSTTPRKFACTNCKKKRIKCDFERPCFQCSTRNMTCEYPVDIKKSPNDVYIMNLLMKKVDQLTKELENQKRLADHWRSVSESKNNTVATNINTQIIGTFTKPIFSKETQQFCSNTLSAVTSVSNAFSDTIKAFMPRSTYDYNTPYAVMIWNRLLDRTPEDCVENIRSTCSIEAATQLLLHCSIFSLGSILYGSCIGDLAAHFYNIATKLIYSGLINPTQDDTAEQWILSLIYTLLYEKFARPFSAPGPLWERASELLLVLPNLEDATYYEIAMTLVVADPFRCTAERTWLKRLDQALPDSLNAKFQLLVTRLFLVLARADPFSASSEIWNLGVQVETIYHQLVDNPYYNFHGLMVYFIKACCALVSLPDPQAEIARCTKMVAYFYSQLTSRSHRNFHIRALEHYRFVHSNRAIVLPDGRRITPMADMMYNLIVQLTGAEPDSDIEQSLTNIGPVNNNNNSNDNNGDMYQNGFGSDASAGIGLI